MRDGPSSFSHQRRIGLVRAQTFGRGSEGVSPMVE